jgi:eukaryotic-like serine/threonine-protein kinase
MTQFHLLDVGQEFAGRYRIERFLAQGGFGAVYIAEQLATEARVAIKVLWAHVLGSSDAVDKFKQEARIAGRVNSDHIVRVIDAGLDEQTQMPFLAMELLNGEDLERVVSSHGALPPDRVIEYLRQVASGLDRAHGYVDRNGQPQPIVHRDLKPENLFLTHRENGEPLVKILDFGIAKVLTSTANVSREIKGTPLFMAFEQASGGATTPQTDIWALGLIAFYLLTAKSYWRSANGEEASLAQLFGEVLTLPLDPPSARLASFGVGSQLPHGFDEWFLRCVNRDPDQRFATAGEAVVALGDAYSIPVATRRPSSGSTLVMSPSSSPTPSGAASGIVSRARSAPELVRTSPSQADEGATLRSVTGSQIALAGTISHPRKSFAKPLAVIGGLLAIFVIGAALVIPRLFSAEPAAGTAGIGVTAEPTSTSSIAATASVPVSSVVPQPSAAPPVASDRPSRERPTAPMTTAAPKTTAPTEPPATARPAESKPSGTVPKPNEYDDR